MAIDPYALLNLERENAYLRARVAQLQADVTDLSAEAHRLRQELEGRYARRHASAPNPLGSGQ
jgi:cell division protein FtsB